MGDWSGRKRGPPPLLLLLLLSHPSSFSSYLLVNGGRGADPSSPEIGDRETTSRHRIQAPALVVGVVVVVVVVVVVGVGGVDKRCFLLVDS